jgi:integrase
MVLRMATPWVHPKTKVFYFRRAVPKRLREKVGKTILAISLGTKDAAQARRLYPGVAAAVEQAWADLEFSPVVPASTPEQTLPSETIMALAGQFYAEFVKAHEQRSEGALFWREKLMSIQQALPAREREEGVRQLFAGSWGFMPMQVANFQVGPQAQEFLARQGIRLSLASRKEFNLRVASALAQAYRHLERRAQGDYRPDPDKERFPPLVNTTTWQTLLSLYLAEREPGPSSRKRQLGVLTAFFAFVGHDFPDAVTVEDALSWKEKRLKEVGSGTVRTADLAHTKSFFRWCEENEKIRTNPFAKVRIKKSNKSATTTGKMREYTDDEARKVLEATLWPPTKKLKEEGWAARRWVPWICAYTGARVNEITQLRFEDIKQVRSRNRKELIWVIKISPEAGTVKDHEDREVAVHPHLIEQGFLDFVRSRKGQRLFYDPGKARGGSAANPQSAKAGERIARWVRNQVGIKDPKIAPNHAWRHLFRSQLIDAEILEQVINATDGHAPASEGQKYGRVWPEASLKAVSAIPAYRFGGREIGWQTLEEAKSASE